MLKRVLSLQSPTLLSRATRRGIHTATVQQPGSGCVPSAADGPPGYQCSGHAVLVHQVLLLLLELCGKARGVGADKLFYAPLDALLLRLLQGLCPEAGDALIEAPLNKIVHYLHIAH